MCKGHPSGLLSQAIAADATQQDTLERQKMTLQRRAREAFDHGIHLV